MEAEPFYSVIYNMYGRGRGRYTGAGKKVPLKGLFADGIWQCNCDPRLPAERFQTKNGGINHGRWFYTCQKPQQRRCNFFLWDEQAKPREASAVLNNSRSEPQTPRKPPITATPYTPPSGRRNDTSEPLTPHTPSKSNTNPRPSTPPVSSHKHTQTQEDLYDWPPSDDDEFSKVAEQALMPPPQSSRKAIKTDILSTPGKRRYSEMAALPTPFSADSDDVFSTPSTRGREGKTLFSTGLLSPDTTPTKPITRYKPLPTEDSDLSTEILDNLRDLQVPLTEESIAVVRGICGKFTLKSQGIAKGRDISRLAIKGKDAKILELQGKISALEAERETGRAVVRHLRRELEVAKIKR